MSGDFVWESTYISLLLVKTRPVMIPGITALKTLSIG